MTRKFREIGGQSMTVGVKGSHDHDAKKHLKNIVYRAGQTFALFIELRKNAMKQITVFFKVENIKTD